MAVSVGSLFITFAVVNIAAPQISNYLKSNTGVHTLVERHYSKSFDVDEAVNFAGPSGQRLIIEELGLPSEMTEALLENNNHEVYKILGVDTFRDYIVEYVTNGMINVITHVVLFVVIFILLKFLAIWLDIVAKLPVISGINQICGAIAGGIEGYFVICLCALMIGIFSGTGWGKMLLEQIMGSRILAYIYTHNILVSYLLGILKSII